MSKKFTIKQLNDSLRRSGLKGLGALTLKNRTQKEEIYNLGNKKINELKLLYKQNFKNVKNINRLKKKDLTRSLAKKLINDFKTGENGVEKDVLYQYDKIRFTRLMRVISPNLTTLDQYYDRVIEYEHKFALENYRILLVKTYFKLKIINNKTKPKDIYRYKFIKYGEYFAHIDELNKWVEDIKNSPESIKTGSDGINDEEYIIDYTHFDLVLIHTGAKAEGISSAMNFFKSNQIDDYEKTYCGLSCLNQIEGVAITKEEYDKEKLSDFSLYLRYIETMNYQVNVISDCIRYLPKIIERTTLEKITVEKKVYRLKKVLLEDVVINYYHKTDENNKIIIYNLDKQHLDITDKIELDDIYIDISGIFYKYKDGAITKINNATKHADDLVANNLTKNIIVKNRFLFLDYETVIDWCDEHILIPYSLSILDCDEEDLITLNQIEKTKDKIKLQEFIKKHSITYVGYDCTEKLLDYIKAKQTDTTYKLCTFNGSNFDHYILYRQCIELNVDNMQAPLINNGQLLHFKLFGRHSTWDICKHINGSLLDNCESFGVDLCKKKEGFNHYNMQKKYEKGELMDFINDKQTQKELIEYNTFDVLSLAIIFYRYSRSFTDIKGFDKYAVEDFITLGSLVMQKFNDYVKEEKINIKKFVKTEKEYKLNYTEEMLKRIEAQNKEQELMKSEDTYEIKKKQKKQKKPRPEELKNSTIKTEYEKYYERMFKYYKDIESNRIAGRVQLFNGVQKITERLASADVCSAYPYNMCINRVYYPIGDIIEIDSYDKLPKSLIGYFYCDINQDNMNVKIVAKKTKEGNDWDVKGTINNVFLSSIMIDYLISCGATVVIRNGIYFSEIIKSCKLFGFLLEVMKLKNEQDVYKDAKDPKYNSVLREVYKLILNIISGKLNQRLSIEERKVMNYLEFHTLVSSNKFDKINTIMMVGDHAHVRYDKNESDSFATARPLYIGTLIYDYTKIYMHKHLYTQVNPQYNIMTDTDSCKWLLVHFIDWVNNYASKHIVPHWPEVEKYDKRYKTHKLYEANSKVFGSFEDEYKNMVNNLAYFLQKKCYLVIDKDFYKKLNEKIEDGELETGRDIDKYIKKNTSFHFKGISKNDVIIKNVKEVENLSKKKLYHKFNSQSKNITRIKDNYIKFFEHLYKNKTATILTSSLKKITNNSKKNVNMDEPERTNLKCYSLIAANLIKTITIK